MHSWWKWCQIVAWTDFKSFEWCETSNPFRELYQIGPIENFKFLKCSKVANPFREWSEKGALANFKYLKCSKVANPVRECSEKVAVANFKYLKCNKVANPFGEWSENIEPFSNALVNQWRLISNSESNMEMPKTHLLLSSEWRLLQNIVMRKLWCAVLPCQIISSM